LAAKQINERIEIPAGKQVQLNLVARSGDEVLLAASYRLTPGTPPTDPGEEKVLRQLWEQTIRRIKQHDIKDPQIRRWFRRHYDIDVNYCDFVSPMPRNRFTVAQLKHFCKCIDRYMSQD